MLCSFLNYRKCGLTVTVKNLHGTLKLNVVTAAPYVDTANLDSGSFAVVGVPCTFELLVEDVNIDFGLDKRDADGEVVASPQNWGYTGVILKQFSGYIRYGALTIAFAARD